MLALQGGSSMQESRSSHLSRWLRTSVCAIAQQGSARGSAVRVSLGLDMRMGRCGYVYRIRVSGCLYLSEASDQSKSSRSQRIRRYGADSSARTVVFCFEHTAEPRRFLLRTRCVTAGRAARDDGIVHLRVTNVSKLHLCFCCTRNTHGMGRGPREHRGDDEGPWPHGGMDAAAMDVGTMTRGRARETRAQSGAGRLTMMRWSAGARDNKVMARGCEERWRDGTRVRGTMARWDADAWDNGAEKCTAWHGVPWRDKTMGAEPGETKPLAPRAAKPSGRRGAHQRGPHPLRERRGPARARGPVWRAGA